MNKGVSWELSGLANTLLSEASRRVVFEWLRNERFCDESNGPSLLFVAGGAGPNFAALVKQLGMRERVTGILEELLQLGLVRQDVSGKLLLCRAAYTQKGIPIETDWNIEYVGGVS